MTTYTPSRYEVETYTGQYLDVQNPDPDKINLEDIAHALSNICRYGGHCKKFYCVPPETPVLTSKMEWKPVGDLQLGEGLLSIEEFGSQGVAQINRRKGQGALVTHNGSIKRHIARLELEDGRVIRSSVEHPWLVAVKKSGNQKWVSAYDLVKSFDQGMTRYLVHYTDPWSYKDNYETGYVAGLFDGEGHVSWRSGGLASIGFAQNSGPVLDVVIKSLQKNNFRFSATKNPRSNCVNVVVFGGWSEICRFLGTYKPKRLASKLENHILSGAQIGELKAKHRLQIVSAKFEPEQEVTALSTTSRTYFADGFAAHNSVAEHAVFVSIRVERKTASKTLALAALHHDDSEAYLGDIPRPLKPLLGESYGILTTQMDDAITDALELPFNADEFHHPDITNADDWSVFVEARNLLPSQGFGWTGHPDKDTEIPSRIIIPDYWLGGLDPDEAELLFLKRHYSLIE